MRINNNLMAMNTHRQYGVNNGNVSKAVEKLSSGYRINRAGDDAAGLAISEKMRAQIRGLSMASKNSQDAISLIQTAEGALQESHNILQRMRELAVQSASDTNETTIDRDALNKEFEALVAEVDDTADKAVFNDLPLVDGTFAKYAVEANANGDSKVDSLPTNATVKVYAEGLSTGFSGTPGDVSIGTFKVTVDGTNSAKVEFTPPGASDTITYNLRPGQTKLQLANGVALTFDPVAANFGNVINSSPVGIFGATSPITDLKVNIQDTGKEFVVQTGANKGDDLALNIQNMGAKALGIFASTIVSREDAGFAIEAVNTAINNVSRQRADMGALQNRLEYKISNLDTSSENLQAAESRIRDLDMAKEMTNFTKHNILSQASTAMLAQANSLPQGVLQLVQG